MRTKIRLITWAALLLWAGCSNDKPEDKGITSANGTVHATPTPEAYHFEFKIDRSCIGKCEATDNEKCETDHQFLTQADYCSGLRNNALNKGCAREERKQLYAVQCGDSFEDSQLGV